LCRLAQDALDGWAVQEIDVGYFMNPYRSADAVRCVISGRRERVVGCVELARATGRAPHAQLVLSW